MQDRSAPQDNPAGSAPGPQPGTPAAELANSAVDGVRRATSSLIEQLAGRFPELHEPDTRASVEPRLVELLRLATALRLDQEASALEPSSRMASKAARLSQRAYRDAAITFEADMLANRIRLSDAAHQRRRAAAAAIFTVVVRAASVLAESLVRSAATALLKG